MRNAPQPWRKDRVRVFPRRSIGGGLQASVLVNFAILRGAATDGTLGGSGESTPGGCLMGVGHSVIS